MGKDNQVVRCGRRGRPMDSEFPEEGVQEVPPEGASLPLEKKLTHKNWKVRCLGYNELGDLFKDRHTSAEDVAPYVKSLHTYAADSHAGAKDAALATSTAYLERCNRDEDLNGNFDDLAKALALQCLNGRPSARDSALEMLMLLTEMGSGAAAPALLEGCKSKVPKVAAGSTAAFRELVHAFGTSVIDPRPLTAQLARLFEHANKDVRKEAMKACIELYRWIGAPFKESLEQLKEVKVDMDKHKAMLNKLAPYFEKADSAEQIQPFRVVTSRNATVVAEIPVEFDKNELKIASSAQKIPRHVLDAVNEEDAAAEDAVIDVVSALPKGWFALCDDKKWSERKNAIDALNTMLRAADVLDINADYGPIVQVLSNLLATDSNVRVVSVTLQSITLLCDGLSKTGFGLHAKGLLGAVISKLKEDKVLEDANNALAMFAKHRCVPPMDVLRQVDPILNATSAPAKQKKSLLAFLKDMLSSDLPDQIINRTVKLLSQSLQSTTAMVRDAAADVLKQAVELFGVEHAAVEKCLSLLKAGGKHGHLILSKVLPESKLAQKHQNDSAPKAKEPISTREKKPRKTKPSVALERSQSLPEQPSGKPKPSADTNRRANSEQPARSTQSSSC